MILTLLVLVSRVKAQTQDPSWSDPQRLSTINADASRPSLVADEFGFVHAFWSEVYQDKPPAILYARFDGSTWSKPVDILVGFQLQGELRFPTAFIDTNDIVHLIWATTQRGPLYYSVSPLSLAGQATAWSNPLMINFPVYRAEMYVDVNDRLHLVYASFWGDQQGVSNGMYYSFSDDAGETWADPLWFDPDIRSLDAPQLMDFEADGNGNFHVLWWYNNVEDAAAPDKPVRYIHSLDNGNTWSRPITIDSGVVGGTRATSQAGPLLAVMDEEVHIVWSGGERNYRNYMYSEDSGQSWSGKQRIASFDELQGQAFDSLEFDRNGVLHFMGQLRTPWAIYHATLGPEDWSTPDLIYLAKQSASEEFGDRIHAHNVDMAFRMGDQIVATFTNPPSEPPMVVYSISTVSDSITQASSIPTVPMAVTVAPLAVEGPDDQAPAELISVESETNAFDRSPPVGDSSTGLTLLLSILPVILIIVGTLVWRSYRRGR